MTSEERREARYQRRREKRQRRLQARNDAVGPLEKALSYRAMFLAGKKCCNGVRWKQSTQNFELHLFSGTAVRRRQIMNGTWEPKKGAHFTIRERGHIRVIDAPHITDRQIHKALTTRVLVPLYGPGMIYDNGASQKGKGMKFHFDRLKGRLRDHYREYGTGGKIILGDYHGFFPNAKRETILARHERLILDPQIRALADTVVNAAPGKVGMPLGVEPSQLEMVSLPSAIDNYMACQVRAASTGHYMDDYHFSAESRERAEFILDTWVEKSAQSGLEANQAKCKIVDAGKPFRFCKTKFQLLPGGRIITHGCRDGMKRARRKMRYFRKQVDAGEKTEEQVAEWLKGPIAYYEQFDDHGRVLKLRRMYYAIFIKGRKTEEVKPCIES